jgi:ABC-type transporter Mla subunit MlaD
LSRHDRKRENDKEIQRLIEFLESTGDSLQDAFEDVDKLARRVESLSNQIIGISRKKG